jgi:hypothetical protein
MHGMKNLKFNKRCICLNKGLGNKSVEEALKIKFLGPHIECIIPKLSSACFAMRIATSCLKKILQN